MLLEEGHKSRLSIHPGMTKMYKDLKATFWWTGMKTDVVDYVASLLVSRSRIFNIWSKIKRGVNWIFISLNRF